MTKNDMHAHMHWNEKGIIKTRGTRDKRTRDKSDMITNSTTDKGDLKNIYIWIQFSKEIYESIWQKKKRSSELWT